MKYCWMALQVFITVIFLNFNVRSHAKFNGPHNSMHFDILYILANGKYALSWHYNNVIMNAMASQITSLTIVYSTGYSRRRSKKTSKLPVTGLCEGNSPVTGEFPTQRASSAENVSIWWRHHAIRATIELNGKHLTHWGRDKMAAISQTAF